MYQIIRRSYPRNIIIYETENFSEAKDICIYYNDNTCYSHCIQKESEESLQRKRNINANMM